jgi:hypothetical protein
MKEPLSTSTQNPKIELPNKELVGVKTTKQKKQDLKAESAKLPVPTGWRILVLPFKQKDKTKGGILLADETVERSQVASTCGLVLDMGPHCYDKNYARSRKKRRQLFKRTNGQFRHIRSWCKC